MRYRLSTNVITRHFQEHSSLYTFMTVLFLMGVIFGAVMVNSLSAHQKEDLFYYLNQFFGQVGDGQIVPPEELLKLSFFHNVKIAGLIWVLGISIIGFPLIFLLIFLKGVVVGFSIGFLVSQMGWQGLLLSFVSLLPQNLFMIPVLIFISVSSIALSMKIIKKVFIRPTFHFQFVPIFAKYMMAYVGAIAIITVAASIEAYISPALMKSVILSIN
ncbi:stage II sporulation protein M [Bacillus sp. SD088]|uniref:stage II sporulation protein M n=1 Tax=Bacillus sp. SD088 TaxID=2782012 RepID=UPI001A971DC0|nr:stage II sporulation protein M [Bacillus sp. SD088]MBO0995320.1 stage II sporulation protein M [Bacillus sp. SD088]